MRAMNVSPARRFESIHALGQRLWEFASPRGQAQWKNFYFHTPAASQAAAKTATFIDESARRDEKPRIESTASLDPGSAMAKTAALRPPAATPELMAATKTAAAAGTSDATSPSHSDIAGESALSDAPIAGGPNPFRRRVIVAVAVAACAGAVLVQRPWRSGGSATPARTASARVAAPASASVPVPYPRRPRPLGPSRFRRLLPSPPRRLAPRNPTREERHATRRHRSPNIDQQGIGIPSD